METQIQSMYDSQHGRQLELDRLYAGGFIADDLEPIKCFKCGSEDFTDEVMATEGGHISEQKVRCAACGQNNGYWAHGYWQV